MTIAARTRDQAQVGFGFCRSFIEAMPDLAGRVTIRKSPFLEIELEAPDGPHLLKAVPSTGKAVLGGAATFAILDERAAWMPSRGAELEAAILTSLGKRGGRCAIISTSAADDANDFSRWLDTPPSGCLRAGAPRAGAAAGGRLAEPPGRPTLAAPRASARPSTGSWRPAGRRWSAAARRWRTSATCTATSG